MEEVMGDDAGGDRQGLYKHRTSVSYKVISVLACRQQEITNVF